MIWYLSSDVDLCEVVRVIAFVVALAINVEIGTRMFRLVPCWDVWGQLWSCFAFLAVTLILWMVVAIVAFPGVVHP